MKQVIFYSFTLGILGYVFLARRAKKQGALGSSAEAEDIGSRFEIGRSVTLSTDRVEEASLESFPCSDAPAF